MVVDHTDSLHQGIADGGADELESSVGQVFAGGVQFWCLGGDFVECFPGIYLWFLVLEIIGH